MTDPAAAPDPTSVPTGPTPGAPPAPPDPPAPPPPGLPTTDGAAADHRSTPIGEYAVLGDGRTAALVSRHGSVDWLCLPRFDAPACFAALLGTPENGRWLLTVPDAHEVSRRYLGDSFVLETTYRTATGTAVVTDAMPSGDGHADLVRSVRCTSGTVTVEHEWIVRMVYGSVVPWVVRRHDGDEAPTIRAIAGPDALWLRGTRLPHRDELCHRDRFDLAAGERVDLSLTWSPSWEEPPAVPPVDTRLEATRIRWAQWASTGDHEGRYRAAVTRSLLVLRMLSHVDTGGIVAAPTTSLPEDFGGERNWDYRFCWLRDASMTLEALLERGFRMEATDWRDWLLRAVAGDPQDLQIMYRVDGRRDLHERELDHLPGYAGSRPVRIGNAAVDQVQLDVLGEVMCALHMAREAGLAETTDSWALQRMLVDDLVASWRHADRGIWEVRGAPRHFTHSKVMAWAAVDRAVRAVEEFGLPGPVEHWRTVRAEIRSDVLAHGYDEARSTFTQSYGGTTTDAALLQIVQVGFLPADDERFRGTVAAIRADLEHEHGLVHRYQAAEADDGLRGGEHAFLACSFWLADALARMGEVDEATSILDRLVGLSNDVGLLAEEYDGPAERMAGNFPQALSHLALLRAVHSHGLAARARARRAALRAS